jgi:hypothetical protein
VDEFTSCGMNGWAASAAAKAVARVRLAVRAAQYNMRTRTCFDCITLPHYHLFG